MNSGVDPLLLPKGQLAYAKNATNRGDFIRQRSPYATISLSFSDQPTQTNFQSGIFQGAGYYKPDVGSESLALAIGGHLFLVTPDDSGNAAVTDITIPGDPNPPGQVQAWIEQAENFLIWNDGLSLPVFYDGAQSRRSNGNSPDNWTIAAGGNVPAEGSTIAIQLSGPYTGSVNETISIGGYYYLVTAINASPAPTYSLTLLNLNEIAGENNPDGSSMVAQSTSGSLGTISSHAATGGTVPVAGNPNPCPIYNVVLSATPASQVSSVYIRGKLWVVIGQGANIIQVYHPVNDAWTMADGDQVTRYGGSGGTTLAVVSQVGGFNAPTLGTTIVVPIASEYTSPDGQYVFIGAALYQVVSHTVPVPPAANANITVKNINQDPGTVATPNTIDIGEYVTLLPELVAGRNLVYGMGRVWEALTDGFSFIASDIVGGSSGSLAYNFRDSVLKLTENDYLFGGGAFRVPGGSGSITAMKFIAMLDVAMGQGPLQVFTTNSVFGCSAPVDRSTWQKMTNPLLPQSLIGAGGVSQDAVTPASGDLLFRSADGGIRSLLMARLDFNQWGNTPISREMQRVTSGENAALLNFDSSVQFDNRFLIAANPIQSGRGMYHTSLLALNFDPISSLQGKADSVWDGEWTGLNVLKLVWGYFNGIERCFAVCLSSDLTQIDLHEILTTDAANGDNRSTPISWSMESPVLDFGDRKSGAHTYKRLEYGEIYIDGMVDDVDFVVWYKPDQWPSWVPWYSFTLPYTPSTDPGFRPRVGLPMPDATACDAVNNRPLREAYNFQIKLDITGKCRFLGGRFSAITIPEPSFAKPVCSS